MKDLLEYLNKYYATDLNGLEEDFEKKFGVDVKRSQTDRELVLFKYNQLSVKWTRTIPHVCRGIILSFTPEGWNVVSYPFDKFFNLHEPFCSLSEKNFDDCPSNYLIGEKADGTCIQVYKYKNEWRASTLGNVDTDDVNKGEVRFGELFWAVLQQKSGMTQENFEKLSTIPTTYIFELCTPQNRVVTKYPESRIYLIGARELGYYRVFSSSELDLIATFLNVRRPRVHAGGEFKSIAEVKAFVEKEGEQKELEEDPGVEYPEGYVISSCGKPIAKLKNMKYLTLHAVIGGENDRCVARHLVENFFNETLDDVVPALSEHHLAGVEALRQAYDAAVETAYEVVDAIYEELKGTDPYDRKVYALLVQKHTRKMKDKVGGWLRGHLYKSIEYVREGLSGDVHALFAYEAARTHDNLDFWKEKVLVGIEQYREANGL